MNVSDFDFFVDLDKMEDFIVNYRLTYVRILEITDGLKQINKTIPDDEWSGAGRDSFGNRVELWLERMDKLKLEILYTIMIVNYTAAISLELKRSSDKYKDILI